MREVIATGKTVEEATENGCLELGLGRDEVSVEILEMPQKKLFKSTPAKVKVTADSAGEEAAPAVAQPAEAAPAPRAESAQPAKAAEKPQPRAEKPSAESASAGALLPAEPEEPIDLAQNERAAQAVGYLKNILDAMGAQAEIKAFKQGDATLLRVEGDAVSEKMEVRGETIQALSYLIDRSVNTGVDKKEEGYLRIRLDIAGYRSRRESELIGLAKRTGKEVARTGRSRTLAPMNPYERLIVHTAISAMEGVTSESIGADVERRVVVKSTGPNATEGDDWRPPRSNNRGGGRQGGSGGGGRGGQRRGGSGGNGPRRDDRRGGGSRPGGPGRESNTPQREYADRERDPNAAPIVPDQREMIKDGEDLPLYGKIEL